MKVLRELWKRITQPSQSTRLVEALAEAKSEHIRDLRVLMDQSAAREKQQGELIRMVVEEKFYRPTVIRPAGLDVNRTTTPLPAEALQDVTAFDENEDKKQMDAQNERSKEIEQGFQKLLQEENEYRAQRGAPPISGPAE